MKIYEKPLVEYSSLFADGCIADNIDIPVGDLSDSFWETEGAESEFKAS